MVPNKLNQNGVIDAGKTLQLPAEGVTFRVTEPTGSEFIVSQVSNTPFKVMEDVKIAEDGSVRSRTGIRGLKKLGLTRRGITVEFDGVSRPSVVIDASVGVQIVK